MSMGKSSFLKFYSVDPSHNFTKESTINDVSKQLFKIDLENSRYNVRAIARLLIRV